MTQKERQARSQSEILRAATEEFGTQNYEAVSMESICSRHGISKGMMYHYYANKDELFLRCVRDTFEMLEAYLKQEAAPLEAESGTQAIKGYFMLRERFFARHPLQKTIFESAMLRTPAHLEEAIQTLRRPIRELNWQLLDQMVARMALRDGLRPETVTWYLACMDGVFGTLLKQYGAGKHVTDLHSALESSEELLNLILFGAMRQKAEPG